jgi:hypothetical protein
MFGSNYLSQRNSTIRSQSSYDGGSFHPRLFDQLNLASNNINAFPLTTSNISNIPRNQLSQNQMMLSQFSNMNNNIGRKGTQQSFSSYNHINYKQFESIFVEKIKNFPSQVNDFLTKEEENINLKLLMDSISTASSLTCKNINKINETYCSKLSNSNACVPKLLEICGQINELLNVIDNELLNQFSLLTKFHGYDESIQNEEKINLNKIQEVIDECNELLAEKIIKVNNCSINYSTDINNNCEQFKNILKEEMGKLSTNLNELIKYKNERNNNYDEYQKITNNIINSINSLKNSFIFFKNKSQENNDTIVIDKNRNENNVLSKDINEAEEEKVLDPNIDEGKNLEKINLEDDEKLQNRMATLKIISEMHNRNRKKRKKCFK